MQTNNTQEMLLRQLQHRALPLSHLQNVTRLMPAHFALCDTGSFEKRYRNLPNELETNEIAR